MKRECFFFFFQVNVGVDRNAGAVEGLALGGGGVWSPNSASTEQDGRSNLDGVS